MEKDLTPRMWIRQGFSTTVSLFFLSLTKYSILVSSTLGLKKTNTATAKSFWHSLSKAYPNSKHIINTENSQQQQQDGLT